MKVGMSLSIRKSSILELEAQPNIHEILDEYATESAIKGLPAPAAKVELYKYLESTDALYTIGAFLDELLIGFVTVLAPVLPHYGRLIAVTESVFVAKAYRKTGAGLKIIASAEEYAKEIGSPGLLMSAPLGGNLAEVLPHIGYDETNRTFFKSFAHE